MHILWLTQLGLIVYSRLTKNNNDVGKEIGKDHQTYYGYGESTLKNSKKEAELLLRFRS